MGGWDFVKGFAGTALDNHILYLFKINIAQQRVAASATGITQWAIAFQQWPFVVKQYHRASVECWLRYYLHFTTAFHIF